MLISFVFSNCSKDAKNVSPESKLSIEAARKFVNQAINSENSSLLSTRSDEEIVNEGFLIDWDNARSFFNPRSNQSIVEAPFLSGIPTLKYLQAEDTNTVVNFVSKNNKVFMLIALNENGTMDYSIMKIGGTIDYYNSYGYDQQNSYYSMDPNFEGIVSYVDSKDSILEVFVVEDNLWYSGLIVGVDSLNPTMAKARQKRFCYTVYTDVPCPCKGHSSDQVGECKCKTKPFEYKETNCIEVDGGGGPNVGDGGTNGGGNGNGGVGGGIGGSSGSGGNGGNNGNEVFNGNLLTFYEKECNINIKDPKYLYIQGQIKLLLENYTNYNEFRNKMTELLKANGVDVNDYCVRKMLGLPDINSGDTENDNYGLTTEEWECAKNTPALLLKIAELKSNGLVDPCQPERKIDAIISELLSKVCSTNEDKFEMFLDELSKIDYIETKKLDARTKCIFDLMMKSNNYLICEQLKQFQSAEINKLNLQFSINNNLVEGVHSNAYTSDANWKPADNLYQIDIILNGNYIENNCDLFILKTLVHETIHATIWAIFNNTTIDKLKIEDHYPGYNDFINKYGDNADHEYMAAKKIPEVIKILQEIYGSKYSYAELETLVWAGLHETAAFKAKFDSPEKINDWKKKIDELKTKCDSPCKK